MFSKDLCSQTGTSIIQVTALDADDPSYGYSARLVYTVTHGQDAFSVDAQTGQRPRPSRPSRPLKEWSHLTLPAVCVC